MNETLTTSANANHPENHEPQKLKELRESFQRVYDGPDSLRHEYELVQEAERLGVPLDTYRRPFELRSEEKLPAYPLTGEKHQHIG